LTSIASFDTMVLGENDMAMLSIEKNDNGTYSAVVINKRGEAICETHITLKTAIVRLLNHGGEDAILDQLDLENCY